MGRSRSPKRRRRSRSTDRDRDRRRDYDRCDSLLKTYLNMNVYFVVQ
jgi:hypothetical protein